jgi:hypothetical protein
VVTSIAESTQNLNSTSSNFHRAQQPRSHSQIATKNVESTSPDFENGTTSNNLKTIVVNNSSQLSSFSPNNQDKKRGVTGPALYTNENQNS